MRSHLTEWKNTVRRYDRNRLIARCHHESDCISTCARVQIIAIFEEQDGRRQQPNGGDGTSASSVGTSSPDIFQNVNCGYPMQCPAAVDITSDQLRYPRESYLIICVSLRRVEFCRTDFIDRYK